MTYSIVAIDRTTGHLGVAVQTCMPAVGATVPWAIPGVGIVASQGFADPAYGPRCLEALRRGSSPEQALDEACAVDTLPMLRQVAVLGADGTTATMTGKGCVDHAGSIAGDGYSAQANFAGSPDVWSAMALAFESASGSLAWRLLAALRAAEAAGGDARGRMSAAVLVVEGQPTDHPGSGTVVNVRVDRSNNPLADLTELLTTADAYAWFGAFVGQFFGGEIVRSNETLGRALAILPGEGNFLFGRVGTLLATGDSQAATHELHQLIRKHTGWTQVFRGFVNKGLMTLPDGLTLDEVLAESPRPA